LQLEQVTSEESNDPANSILAQSPAAGTQINRGSSVDVKVAQAIETVSVPNIVQHEEADAINILEGVGLQLGAVDEKMSDAATGSVLSQNPDAGTRVLTGSVVDVTLSQQTAAHVVVLVYPTNPSKGESVQFHAHMEPPEKGMQYRFAFGDRTDSGWLAGPNTTHIYREGGDFKVQAIATRAATTVESEEVTVSIPSFPWSLAAGVAAGVLFVGGAAGVSHWRRLQCHEWIRVAPKTDAGKQTVAVDSHDGSSSCARIRVRHDTGKSRVLFEEEKHEGKKYD